MFRLKYLWWAFVSWLEEHEPVTCVTCGRFMFRCDAHVNYSVMGFAVNHCDECHRDLFRPFGDDED